MEPELKKEYLYPYLQHKLQVKSEGREPKYVTLCNGGRYEISVYTLLRSMDHYKLLLHPLSMLTKPIEHNGEKFVPLMVLFSCSVKEEEEFDIYGTIPEYWKIIMKTDIANDLEYRFMKRLFEWHFNVFNLPKHLWIDKNSTSSPRV